MAAKGRIERKPKKANLMGKKRRKSEVRGQLEFDWTACGGLPAAQGGGVESRSGAVQGSQKPVSGCKFQGTETLMERVATMANLKRAWERVRANKGSCGVDGESVAAYGERAWERLLEMRKRLLGGTYRPSAVRGVEIPKPSGGVRQLGIPTVEDRIAQQAVAQVLAPLYETVFSESSYGFRPGRGAHMALRKGAEHVAEGFGVVVDLDLEKFFDRVNHDRLMARLARDIADKRVLRLVRGFLEAGLMKDGVCQRRGEGTPQGGPLSPLLANVVLDELDKELERRGHRFCRYADDCNIYVRSQKAGERVMEGIRRFIERKLRLKVNEAKSRVAPSRECKFLGYTIGTGGRLWVSTKSKERMRAKLKSLTKRNRGRALGEVIGEVNRYAAGWLEYFRLAAAKKWLAGTEGWLRRRLRCYRLKQCKRRIGVARFLMERGCREDHAWMLAMSRKGWYRKSASPQATKAMDTGWFRLQGLRPLALPTV